MELFVRVWVLLALAGAGEGWPEGQSRGALDQAGGPRGGAGRAQGATGWTWEMRRRCRVSGGQVSGTGWAVRRSSKSSRAMAGRTGRTRQAGRMPPKHPRGHQKAPRL